MNVCKQIGMRCQKAVEVIAKNYATAQPVSASFGIALYPHHGKNVKELLTMADKQMYKMKSIPKSLPFG